MLSFSPHGRINQVPVDMIFDAVRYVMFRWGHIGMLRVDNGAPFGDPTRQTLTALNLHLRCLGVWVKLNPPRSPRKNAKVERNQGTTARWADPKQCKDYLDLQANLNRAVEDQREYFQTRTCNYQTRAEKFPELFCNPKRFHPDGFFIHFAFDCLSKGTWKRKVSREGATDVFGRTYQVGRPHRNKEVLVSLDKETLSWVFTDLRGEKLKTFNAKNLTEANIRNLSLCQ